jgi:hypothetical protein
LGHRAVDNVSGVPRTLFPASYWSAEFGTFLEAPALASHWPEDFTDGTVRQRQGKLTTRTLLTRSEAPPAAIQSTFSWINFTLLVG